VNSAVSDPILFSALTWIWPTSFDVMFFTVSVDELSLVSTLAPTTASPAWVQLTFGFGVPDTVTDIVRVEPAFNFNADLYLSSYVIAGLPAKHFNHLLIYLSSNKVHSYAVITYHTATIRILCYLVVNSSTTYINITHIMRITFESTQWISEIVSGETTRIIIIIIIN